MSPVVGAKIHFTAGPNGETDGLFGTITPASKTNPQRCRDRYHHAKAQPSRRGSEPASSMPLAASQIPVAVAANCARGDKRVEPDRRQRQSANPPRPSAPSLPPFLKSALAIGSRSDNSVAVPKRAIRSS